LRRLRDGLPWLLRGTRRVIVGFGILLCHLVSGSFQPEFGNKRKASRKISKEFHDTVPGSDKIMSQRKVLNTRGRT